MHRRLAPLALSLWPALLLAAIACTPIVRPAPFVGAKDGVADVSLVGPFDGQIVDATTNEPVSGATVVGVWSYDRGDGLVAPVGSELVTVRTDVAGRYKLPEAPLRVRGSWVRLVAFTLVAYKRGYVGYRSDVELDGSPRSDFVMRHNKVALRKWRDSDSHARHLAFLRAPPAIEQLAKWEREPANLDLLREQGGALPTPTEPEQEGTLQVLDASSLLPPEDVRRRTGYAEAFDERELGDLVRTHFYHGVHLQAVDRDETWDVALRVWKDPPGGLDGVVETFKATLPGVEPKPEITDETWLYQDDKVRAVAFLDRERKVGILLTCGASQCVDLETAIILAKLVHDRLDQLALVDAPTKADTPPSPRPAREPRREPEPTAEPEPKAEPETEPKRGGQ